MLMEKRPVIYSKAQCFQQQRPFIHVILSNFVLKSHRVIFVNPIYCTLGRRRWQADKRMLLSGQWCLVSGWTLSVVASLMLRHICELISHRMPNNKGLAHGTVPLAVRQWANDNTPHVVFFPMCRYLGNSGLTSWEPMSKICVWVYELSGNPQSVRLPSS